MTDHHTDDFATHYDAHADLLFRFVMSRVWHRQTAEDLTSEIFEKAYRKHDSFDPQKASYKTWLFTIARNTIIDYFRAKKETKNIDDCWDIDDDSDIPRDAALRIQLAAVQKKMRQLTPREREVVTLRVWHDLPHAEIAAILGTSEAAVKMHFSRAVHTLRSEIVLLFVLLFRIPLL